jgi:hypothetical protein
MSLLNLPKNANKNEVFMRIALLQPHNALVDQTSLIRTGSQCLS